MTPAVSVIMPVYNAEQTLAESLESVLKQTFTDFELLLIDDASTDRTLEIAESFSDTRIQIIRKAANTGLVDSLNIGLETSRGPFVARMDGDDICLPARLERQVAYLTSHPDVSIIGSSFELMPGGQVIKTLESPADVRVWLLKKSVLGHPTIMFRKADLEAAGLRYTAEALHAEDYQLWTDAQMAGLQIANCGEVLLRYRVHPAQVSKVHAARQSEEVNRIRLRYWKYLFPGCSPGNEEIIRQMATARYRDYGSYANARRFCKAILRENKSTQVVDEASLKWFLHMTLARAAVEVYRNLNVGLVLVGLRDQYFFRTIAARLFSKK